MIIFLTIAVTVLSIFLISSIIHIRLIQKELIEIDKEQHQQNQDVINLIKSHIKNQDTLSTHQEMLLQHIEILKYLVEQDPKLNAGKSYFMGPVGEA